MEIQTLLAQIQGSGLAQLIDSSRYYSISFQSLHILAFTLALATVVLFNIRLNGAALGSLDVRELVLSIRPYYNASVLVALIAGVLIFLPRAVAYSSNQVFVNKLLLLLLVIVLQWLLIRRVLNSTNSAASPALRLGFAGALILWFGVGAYGRAVGFV